LKIHRREQHIVKHEYHDHAFDDTYALTTKSKKTKNAPRGGVTTPFPVKLHNILQKNIHDDIISWQPHGRSFLLRKPKDFVTEVMPLYFKQSKLTSFQRQLNLYGFSRLTSGPDKGGYYHELFLRGKDHLCTKIMRMKVKGTRTKAASDPSTEPNFYLMPALDGSSSESVSPKTNQEHGDQKYARENEDDISCLPSQPLLSVSGGSRKESDAKVARNPAITLQVPLEEDPADNTLPVCVSAPIATRSSTSMSGSIPHVNIEAPYLPIGKKSKVETCSINPRTSSSYIDTPAPADCYDQQQPQLSPPNQQHQTQELLCHDPPLLSHSSPMVSKKDTLTFEGKEFYYLDPNAASFDEDAGSCFETQTSLDGRFNGFEFFPIFI